MLNWEQEEIRAVREEEITEKQPNNQSFTSESEKNLILTGMRADTFTFSMDSRGQHGATLNLFLEGIQMRLTDKYRPQRRIVLPPDYTNRLQEDIEAILDLDYSFKLEEQVLAADPQPDGKTKETDPSWPAAVAVDETLPPIVAGPKTVTDGEKAKSRHVPPPRPPPPLPAAVKELAAAVSLNPMLASVSYRPMEPQIAQPPGTSTGTAQNPNRDFRVEDFEPNSANPFDNLELKSLNDMEQLQQVLAKDKESTK